MRMLTAFATLSRDASLELCDVIVIDLEKVHGIDAPLELCEHIVAQIEWRAMAREIDARARSIHAELPPPVSLHSDDEDVALDLFGIDAPETEFSLYA